MRASAIVGDIHGEGEQLASLLEILQGRQLIFVGDYVNRGTDSRWVLEQLLSLKRSEPDTVCLLGNHDAAFLAYLGGQLPLFEFAALGGLATIRSYAVRAWSDVRAEVRRAVPEAHQSFLSTCADFFENEGVIVSHCGINPLAPNSRQRRDMIATRHDGLFASEFRPSKLVVCGHYVQLGGIPHESENLVCLDTGCGTACGPLTALLLPEREFVRVSKTASSSK